MKMIDDSNAIDFVITWVDGSDEKWINEKKYYQKGESNDNIVDSSAARYRDWGLLKFWFRGVEKYAPWVHKVHFVTWGHIPAWLNVNHPKINIVKHSDYIPEKYLPTFNSNTIDLNLHRIDGLSDKFVFFNDDFFLISKVEKKDFFFKDIPMDSAVLSPHCFQYDSVGTHFAIADVGVINSFYDMREVIKRDFWKWFTLKYEMRLLAQTAVMLATPRFPGFWQPHIAQSFCKSTFEKLWNKIPQILDDTCKNRFRSMYEVNQWLMREWQICEGNFMPRDSKFGKSFVIRDSRPKDVEKVKRIIKDHSMKCIAINDSNMDLEFFEYAKGEIMEGFMKILPHKSTYEV